MANAIPGRASHPLDVEEVIKSIRNRWGVTYELRLRIKDKSLYLQMMWGYLEQQSFPLNDHDYREKLEEVLEVVNRIDKTSEVRFWLLNVKGKPRLGRALSLPLRGDARLGEFVL